MNTIRQTLRNLEKEDIKKLAIAFMTAVILVCMVILKNCICSELKSEKVAKEAERNDRLITALSAYEEGVVPEGEDIVVTEYDRTNFDMKMLFHMGEPKDVENSDFESISNWEINDEEYYCIYKKEAYTVVVAGIRMN